MRNNGEIDGLENSSLHTAEKFRKVKILESFFNEDVSKELGLGQFVQDNIASGINKGNESEV